MKSPAQRALSALAAKQFGGDYGDGLSVDAERATAARHALEKRQAAAERIGVARRARGAQTMEGEPSLAELRAAVVATENDCQARHPQGSKAKRAQRERRDMKSRTLATAKRGLVREAQAAAELAEEVFLTNGIRHHFRPLPKTAWFAAHMATYDRDGLLALQALASCGMPSWRLVQVLHAAASPEGYTPKFDVCRGERDHQSMYEYDGHVFGGHRQLWTDDGRRVLSHPASIRVMCTAVFLWMAKTRSGKSGMTYKIHGFGHGVFTSMLRCSNDAIFGHSNGMPGAMLALKAAGFINYHQPPPDELSPLDIGPSGHAYSMFWIPSHPKDSAQLAAVEATLELMAELGREVLPEHWQRANDNDGRRPIEPRPPDIDPAIIPF